MAIVAMLFAFTCFFMAGRAAGRASVVPLAGRNGAGRDVLIYDTDGAFKAWVRLPRGTVCDERAVVTCRVPAGVYDVTGCYGLLH